MSSAAKKPVKQEVITTQPSAVPAFMASKVQQDAGKGVSTAQDDNLVPLIYILQALSPQVNKKNPAYVEGAEAGDLLLRNAPQPLIKGSKGFVFQPCYFFKNVIERKPQATGVGIFVAAHPEMTDDVTAVPDQKNPNKMVMMRKNGNVMIDTRNHVGLVYMPGLPPMPYVIPMSSTGHTASKGWMGMMNQKLVGNDIAPSFACLYTMKTKDRSNAAGQMWATWDIQDAGWVQSEEDYNRGKALNEAFARGEKTADVPEEAEPQEHGGDTM